MRVLLCTQGGTVKTMILIKPNLSNRSCKTTAPVKALRRSRDGDAAGTERITLDMKAVCVNGRITRSARASERTQRRMERLAERTKLEERARDQALARLVAVLEHAHAIEIPHLTGRFRIGDGYSRLARLRAAHATYALATMNGMERASDGAFVRA